MKHNTQTVEAVLFGFLRLGDIVYPPAFGRKFAIPRAYLLDKVNRSLRPSFCGEEDWEPLTPEQLQHCYARSSIGFCCCDDGIYLPDSPEDIRAVEEYLLLKIKGIGRRVARIRRAWPQFGPYREQLILPGLDEPDGEVDES